MFVFPHTNKADVFLVNHEIGVNGPMTPEGVKTDYPEFAKIELPAQKFCGDRPFAKSIQVY